MMKLFYMNANTLSSADIELILARSEAYRIEKYEKAGSSYSAKESLCAGALLRYAVSNCAAVSFDSVRSGYAVDGRPVLLCPESVKSLYISLSHTEGHIFCAVSEFPVGVDAEHVRAFDKALIERFFTPEEQKYIALSHTVDEAQTRFFDIWTTKEAYFKCGYENLVSFLKVDSLTVKGKVSKRYGKLLITVVGEGQYTEVEDVTERVIAFFGENG